MKENRKNLKKIYILHGWAYSTEKWKPFIEELRINGLDVEMLEIPGLTAPLHEVWHLDDYVNWLKQELVNEKDKVILLGHSNGGRISIAFATKFPDRVEKLILIDSAGIYHNELPIRIKRLVFGAMARAGKQVTTSKILRKILYKLAREKNYEEVAPIVRQTMANLLDSDKKYKLNKIQTDTLIIWGGSDKITPVSDGQKMNNEIRDSKFFLVTGAKHSPMFTSPDKVAEIIKNNL